MAAGTSFRCVNAPSESPSVDRHVTVAGAQCISLNGSELCFTVALTWRGDGVAVACTQSAALAGANRGGGSGGGRIAPDLTPTRTFLGVRQSLNRAHSCALTGGR